MRHTFLVTLTLLLSGKLQLAKIVRHERQPTVICPLECPCYLVDGQSAHITKCISVCGSPTVEVKNAQYRYPQKVEL